MLLRKLLGIIKTILAKNKIALVLFAVAAFLRAYRFEDFVTFLGDQGRDAIIIKRILTLEHFPAIGAPSSIGQVFLGPFYYYLIAPFLLIFNFYPLGPAVGVFFLSFAALISTFFIIKKEIDVKAALIFLVLLAFSITNIDLSRYSWNPNLLPVFSFFTLYFFSKLLTTQKTIYAFLFGSFLSFSIQFHYLASLLFLPIFVIYVHTLFSKKTSIFIKQIFISIVSFLFFLSPLILFDIRHSFLNTKNLLQMFQKGEVITNASYIARLLQTIQAFFFNIFKVEFGQFLPLLIMLTLGFVFLLKYKKINLLLKINFLNIFFFLLIFSFLNSQKVPHYYGAIYYSFYLAIAYFLTQIKNTYFKYIFISLFLAFYILFNAKNYYFLYNQPNKQITQAKNIAQSIAPNISAYPYQTVSLPYFETDGHIRYFLEINNYKPLELDSPQQPEELFVLCFAKTCSVLGNAQWQTASFKNAKIDKIWTVEGIKIYKLVHGK